MLRRIYEVNSVISVLSIRCEINCLGGLQGRWSDGCRRSVRPRRWNVGPGTDGICIGLWRDWVVDFLAAATGKEGGEGETHSRESRVLI